MESRSNIEQDLRFVKQAVRRRETGRAPRSIALLWAAFVFVGFTGLDFRPREAGLFLLLGGPVFYLVSLWLGASAARSAGVSDRDEGRRHMLHWGGLLVGVGALAALTALGLLPPRALGLCIVVLVGLAYFLAGVHFQLRGYLWFGPALMAGALLPASLDRWGWTLLGALAAAGILASARALRRHE